jgi:hypothetical protein
VLGRVLQSTVARPNRATLAARSVADFLHLLPEDPGCSSLDSHASVDCDEFVFYVRGSFTSRRGVGPGSVSHHPAGVAHRPHPGAYEGSIGHSRTDELAVMLDTTLLLRTTSAALAVEDPGYQDSFIPAGD